MVLSQAAENAKDWPPAGLARFIRQHANGGEEIAIFMIKVLRNQKCSVRDRIAAATWVADRAFVKVPIIPDRLESLRAALRRMRRAFAPPP
jgi:hypothetical protein